MKTLKFSPKLVELIQNGTKITSWRLFDDKNIQEGDELIFIKRPELMPFAEARVVNVTQKNFKDLNDENKEGHEGFDTEEDMYETYSDYYKRPVTPETEVKVIKFEVVRFV